MRDFELVDHNLRTALRFFGEATGTGEVRLLDGVQAVSSGLDYGVFNIALLTGPLSHDTVDHRIAEGARYFRPGSQHWSFWVCEDLLDGGVRRKSRQAFSDRGMRVISQPPGMLAEALRPPVHALPAIECHPVDNHAMRSAFAEITSVCFDIPFPVSQAVYVPERAWQGDYRGYIGLAAGKPVAMVALVTAAGVLGVYSLATLPRFRRCGYGEALLRAAIARQHHGERLILQSTDAGYRLYRRLGFRDVSKYSVYLTT